MWGDPHVTTVSNEDRKDTDMKLLLIFAAILAFSLAEEEKKAVEPLDDSQAEASAAVELMKEGVDLTPAASSYNTYVPPSQRPPHWTAPNYVPPQNTWVPPKEPVKPIQPIHTGVPANVQNDYYDPHYQHWTTPTTTPTSVIKNEMWYGDNGHYKYEYQIADGTHVGEEGYYTDPKQTEESLVKKGWYSYRGADGKVYTVTYWADRTGYHAYGAHLPTPPAYRPYQADDSEAEKNKPQHDYPTQTAAPVHYPTQTAAPVHYPTQTAAPIHYPTHAPAHNHQQQAYVPPQVSTYQPPQQPYYPPKQPYYPPQQNYYPQQPTNNL